MILESEKGSSKVLKRFGAAVGGRVLFSDIGGLFEEEKVSFFRVSFFNNALHVAEGF